MRLLVDALYINNGGGRILLNYLITKLEDLDINVYYLLDNRCKQEGVNIENNKVTFLVSTLSNRYKFYKKNGREFDKIFCFGNLPPINKVEGLVYTYFHQSLYLKIPSEFGFKLKSVFLLKHFFLNSIKNNTSFWLVQSSNIKDRLVKRYDIESSKVLISPFYPNDDLLNFGESRINNRFLYVSGGASHKNHERLINAFCSFYDKFKLGELILTVGKEFQSLNSLICSKQNMGYPIINIGFVNREELIYNYNQAEYLIFPSLEESLGLGIVEAIECGCKVIGADLPYIYEVCNPSIIFDPLDVKSIEQVFVKAVKKEEKETEQKIFNEINQLISLLKN